MMMSYLSNLPDFIYTLLTRLSYVIKIWKLVNRQLIL